LNIPTTTKTTKKFSRENYENVPFKKGVYYHPAGSLK